MPLVEIWLEKGWLPRPNSSQGSVSSQQNMHQHQHQHQHSQQSQHSQHSQQSGHGARKENEGFGSQDRSDRRDMAPPTQPQV